MCACHHRAPCTLLLLLTAVGGASAAETELCVGTEGLGPETVQAESMNQCRLGA